MQVILPKSDSVGKKKSDTLLSVHVIHPGVTQGKLRPEIAAIAVPATLDGRDMAGNDFALTAGWGHYGSGDAVIPGQGRLIERAYTSEERAGAALGTTLPRARRGHLRHLSEPPRLVAQRPRRRLALQPGRLPDAQEMALLPRTRHSRSFAQAGVQHFTDTARRIGAIMQLVNK